MAVGAEQIIVGAGTEVLYSLLVQLLGREPTYGVEDPGYGKIARIYRSLRRFVRRWRWTSEGLSVQALRRSGRTSSTSRPATTIPRASSCPSPGGRSCCAGRRRSAERCILEDDYDSEFRFVGRPSPRCSPWTRAGSVDLSEHLLQDHRPLHPHQLHGAAAAACWRTSGEKLGFYACTVSAFEQYTLAQFMPAGPL